MKGIKTALLIALVAVFWKVSVAGTSLDVRRFVNLPVKRRLSHGWSQRYSLVAEERIIKRLSADPFSPSGPPAER